MANKILKKKKKEQKNIKRSNNPKKITSISLIQRQKMITENFGNKSAQYQKRFKKQSSSLIPKSHTVTCNEKQKTGKESKPKVWS